MKLYFLFLAAAFVLTSQAQKEDEECEENCDRRSSKDSWRDRRRDPYSRTSLRDYLNRDLPASRGSLSLDRSYISGHRSLSSKSHGQPRLSFELNLPKQRYRDRSVTLDIPSARYSDSRDRSFTIDIPKPEYSESRDRSYSLDIPSARYPELRDRTFNLDIEKSRFSDIRDLLDRKRLSLDTPKPRYSDLTSALSDRLLRLSKSDLDLSNFRRRDSGLTDSFSRGSSFSLSAPKIDYSSSSGFNFPESAPKPRIEYVPAEVEYVQRKIELVPKLVEPEPRGYSSASSRVSGYPSGPARRSDYGSSYALSGRYRSDRGSSVGGSYKSRSSSDHRSRKDEEEQENE